MRSLEAFIEENGQWERAARRLYCHRHTLRYRIRRVEELTGREPVERARPDRVLAGPARAGTGLVNGCMRVKVGVPTEVKPDEYRVALTPAGVRELVDAGHEVLVQSGAGEGSAIAGRGYAAQGAAIVPDAEAVFDEAELIVKVKEPQPAEVATPRAAPHALHVPAPRRRRGVDAGADGVGRDVHRVRDRRGRPRPAAAARADVRGGGQDRDPGGRVHPREAARRARDPARRRARAWRPPT